MGIHVGVQSRRQSVIPQAWVGKERYGLKFGIGLAFTGSSLGLKRPAQWRPGLRQAACDGQPTGDQAGFERPSSDSGTPLANLAQILQKRQSCGFKWASGHVLGRPKSLIP